MNHKLLLLTLSILPIGLDAVGQETYKVTITNKSGKDVKYAYRRVENDGKGGNKVVRNVSQTKDSRIEISAQGSADYGIIVRFDSDAFCSRLTKSWGRYELHYDLACGGFYFKDGKGEMVVQGERF